MDLIAAFQAFQRVSETGSFSAAAREIETTQPNISRQISALEARVGARLFQRTTRRMMLTEDGQNLLMHVRHVLDALGEAERALDRRHNGVSGLVRLAVPSAFGRLRLAPRIGTLLKAHPELKVDLRFEDAVEDLVASGLDLLVRAAPVTDTSMIIRRLTSIERCVIASAAYLNLQGEPETPEELANHECILSTTSAHADIWSLTRENRTVDIHVHGRLRSDSVDAMRASVLHGYGIGLLHELYFAEAIAAGTVRVILPGWHQPDQPVYLIYPSRQHVPARVRVVIEFLLAAFTADFGV
jgi:DNA-binding transcriptional LysR family regulator